MKGLIDADDRSRMGDAAVQDVHRNLSNVGGWQLAPSQSADMCIYFAGVLTAAAVVEAFIEAIVV